MYFLFGISLYLYNLSSRQTYYIYPDSNLFLLLREEIHEYTIYIYLRSYSEYTFCGTRRYNCITHADKKCSSVYILFGPRNNNYGYSVQGHVL